MGIRDEYIKSLQNEYAVQRAHENKPLKGKLGCKDNCCDYPDCHKDDCCDYPDCHPSCRVRWYHK